MCPDCNVSSQGIGLWIEPTYPGSGGQTGFSTPGAGASIRIEANEVYGPYGLIFLKLKGDFDPLTLLQSGSAYSGAGGVFGGTACEYNDDGTGLLPTGLVRQYQGNSQVIDCAFPGVSNCPPPSPPPAQPPAPLTASRQRLVSLFPDRAAPTQNCNSATSVTARTRPLILVPAQRSAPLITSPVVTILGMELRMDFSSARLRLLAAGI